MQVFLSYHNPDRALAKRLKAALEGALPGVQVFFAEDSQHPGGLWQELQSRRIQECDAFIILVGSEAGEWQKLEYYEARARLATDKRMLLLPVIIVDRARETVANLPGLTLFHWLESVDPAAPEPLARIVAALSSGQVAAPPEPWRLIDPYRGLESLDEQDMDFFFGRETETAAVLERIAAAGGRVIALIGNSGVGKSSLAKAGVLGALKAGRTAHTGELPALLRDSRRWAYLTMTPGTDPFTALAHQFLRLWQLDPTDPAQARKVHDWVAQLRGADGATPLTVTDLLDATDAHVVAAGGRAPPRYLLYIDQAEELHTRTTPDDHERFSAGLADALRRAPERLTVLMSHRSDYYGHLQTDAALFPVTERIDVAPLAAEQMKRALSEPARVLGARFENAEVVAHLVDSTRRQADALPLLADLLQDLWKRMRARGDGVLRISDHPDLMQVGAALRQRADAFLRARPDKVDAVRRLFTLRLAEVPRVGEPVRAEMVRDESTAVGRAEWALAEELSGPQLRLLVTGDKDGQSKAWVAHEVLLRCWDTLAAWLEDEREFLVWRSEAQAKRRIHAAAAVADQPAALLMGLDLETARRWRSTRAADLDAGLVAFIDASVRAADRSARQRRRLQRAVGALMLLVIMGLSASIFEQRLRGLWFKVRYGHPVSTEEALALAPRAGFLDCGDVTGKPGTALAGYSAQCPEMVVIPAGSFVMGSAGGRGDGSPPRKVTIARPFAISRFEITGEQWRRCAEYGGCRAADGAKDGVDAVASISRRDAEAYAAWLGGITGVAYRLPTEAEWERAALGDGTRSTPWDDEADACRFANIADRSLKASLGTTDATAGGLRFAGCDDGQARSTTVGRHLPNPFGLHDMTGNLWEWVEDCFHEDYGSTPPDGSARRDGDCSLGVVRGGGWYTVPAKATLRYRWAMPADRADDQEVGFRVIRPL